MEFLVFYFLIFFLGSSVGSFLTVLVYRWPRQESLIHGRSHCDDCKKKLQWIDLLPVFSYILLGGRCRYCRGKISAFYPLVEKIMGVLFVLVVYSIVGYNYPLLADSRYLITVCYFLYIVSSLMAIFFTDLKYGIIPFKIVFSSVILTFLWLIFLPPPDITFLNYLFSAIGVFVFFFFLFFITKGRGLGFGDVVYVFLMGLLLGFPKIIVGLYIAFLSGALISLVLVGLRRKKIHGGTIPFGPFLVSGTIISMLWGQMIVHWALQYLT